MTGETNELEADHPIRWLVWEWQNDRNFVFMWAGVALLITVLLFKAGNITFILVSGYFAASMLKYFIWMRAVKHGKIQAQS